MKRDALSVIQLTRYDCISQRKSCISEGGLLIYVNKCFNYEVKMNLNTFEQDDYRNQSL